MGRSYSFRDFEVDRFTLTTHNSQLDLVRSFCSESSSVISSRHTRGNSKQLSRLCRRRSRWERWHRTRGNSSQPRLGSLWSYSDPCSKNRYTTYSHQVIIQDTMLSRNLDISLSMCVGGARPTLYDQLARSIITCRTRSLNSCAALPLPNASASFLVSAS